MIKHKENHTGFVDNKLHCFNCGESYDMNLPQPVKIAAFMMREFDKKHKKCKK